MPAAQSRSPPRLPELSFTVAVAATERLDRFLADQLGLSDAAGLLQQNLREEEETSQLLEALSEKLGQELKTS